VDAFAAAAAESLGWLIGRDSAAGRRSQPGRLGSSPAEGPADAACHLWLNVTLFLNGSRFSQPCHAVPGPADLPGGWGAVRWWMLPMQTACQGDRRGGRIGIFAGLKTGWQFAAQFAQLAWGFQTAASLPATPPPPEFAGVPLCLLTSPPTRSVRCKE